MSSCCILRRSVEDVFVKADEKCCWTALAERTRHLSTTRGRLLLLFCFSILSAICEEFFCDIANNGAIFRFYLLKFRSTWMFSRIYFQAKISLFECFQESWLSRSFNSPKSISFINLWKRIACPLIERLVVDLLDELRSRDSRHSSKRISSFKPERGGSRRKTYLRCCFTSTNCYLVSSFSA